jgi:3-methyladenine DNA glycosylase AlkD
MSLEELKKELKSKANKEKAKLLQGFFKTGKGEYGEGDVFLGVIVPETRKTAIKFKSLPLKDVEELLKSKFHEERLCALLLLVHNYNLAKKNKDEKTKEDIFNFYLKSTNYINNWDLVDLSCHQIIGDFLKDKDKSILYQLAKSDNIWDKRISIISTAAFIKDNNFEYTITISEILLNDKHDLIHKAVGWMLREMGKRNKEQLIQFLNKHYKQMPRTMLRYSIEKLPENQRKQYLNGNV